MKSKIFNRKTVALLAAVGLTAGLLTPVTTNITFAQDNGIKIVHAHQEMREKN